MERKLKMEESFRAGWACVKPNFLLLFGLAVVAGVLGFIGKQGAVAGLIAGVARWIFGAVVILISLRVVRSGGQRVGALGDLPLGLDTVLRYLWVSLVTVLIIVGGLILLIVPGVYWALKYQFAPVLALDEGLPLGQALGRSAELTEGLKMDFLIFLAASLGLMLLGLLALIVGIIPAAMTVHLAWLWVYDDLRRQGAEKA